ncbi:uncharacterized protein LOC125512181 [Triticum urartu]|uniref:Uncharacterized protein n=1 Tax=Triticum urartu TaxID=4572 RepID=A0A8R7QSN7_TRIUA|nr:uncharacterized protein LOC125512181 [Triticum urartu]
MSVPDRRVHRLQPPHSDESRHDTSASPPARANRGAPRHSRQHPTSPPPPGAQIRPSRGRIEPHRARAPPPDLTSASTALPLEPCCLATIGEHRAGAPSSRKHAAAPIRSRRCLELLRGQIRHPLLWIRPFPPIPTVPASPETLPRRR